MWLTCDLHVENMWLVPIRFRQNLSEVHTMIACLLTCCAGPKYSAGGPGVVSHEGVSVGLLYCILSLLCAVVLGLFDWRAEKILKRKDEKKEEKISFRDIKDFPLRLWLIFLICVAYYVTVFPFIGLAT